MTEQIVKSQAAASTIYLKGKKLSHVSKITLTHDASRAEELSGGFLVDLEFSKGAPEEVVVQATPAKGSVFVLTEAYQGHSNDLNFCLIEKSLEVGAPAAPVKEQVGPDKGAEKKDPAGKVGEPEEGQEGDVPQGDKA